MHIQTNIIHVHAPSIYMPLCSQHKTVMQPYHMPQLQGAANQFEMWSEESLFLLVLYKGMKTKLGLRRGLQKNFNK